MYALISSFLLAAVYGVFLYLLRRRHVSLIVMRMWFTFHMLLSLMVTCLFAVIFFLLMRLNLLDIATAQSLQRCVCATTFGYWLRFNSPHIRVERLPGSLPFSAIKQQHDMCLCHTSFFDTILFLWFVPYRYISNAKTFAKAGLTKLPLLGTMITSCGHFLVYFTSSESSCFSVQKEKQAAVAADVEDFLNKGGSLSFFPEGALNRTPEVLRDFRLGSFSTILRHKLRLYYCVTYGNHEVWSPSLKGMPGYPADIYVYVGKYEYDPDKVDAAGLAKGLREEMQKHIDQMLALRAKRGYQPWWKASTAASSA